MYSEITVIQGATEINPAKAAPIPKVTNKAGRAQHSNVPMLVNRLKIGNNVLIKSFSHLESCKIENKVEVGPYARIRPDTILKEGSKIGNFVEVKKSIVGKKSKVNHLSYIGDTTIGKSSNIGAGTITCNYDGTNKHKTTIGEESFIGTNSSLVAPVNIGKGAFVGAGSTITKDVPDEALAVARGKQANKEDWAKNKK